MFRFLNLEDYRIKLLKVLFYTHLKHTCGSSFCESCVWTKDNFSGGEQPSVWGAGASATEDMQGERWHHNFLQGGKIALW